MGGSERGLADSVMYPWGMSLAEAMTLWHRVRLWRVELALYFAGVAIIANDVSMERVVVGVGDERHTIDPRDLFDLQAGGNVFGQPHIWRGVINQSTATDRRVLDLSLYVFYRGIGNPFASTSGGFSATRHGFATERGFWSGKHVQRIGSRCEPGIVSPSVCLSISSGIWTSGGVDQVIEMSSAGTDLAPSSFITSSIDDRLLDIYGPYGPFTGSLALRPRYFPFAGTDGLSDVYDANTGAELLNPLKARVP